MDIVDIDKVLDDLELNEDQQMKDGHTTNTSNRSNSHGSQPKMPLATIAQHRNQIISESVPVRMPKTNYVNVSNVFLSLNEYVNASVNDADVIDQSAIASANERPKQTPVERFDTKFVSTNPIFVCEADGPAVFPNESSIATTPEVVTSLEIDDVNSTNNRKTSEQSFPEQNDSHSISMSMTTTSIQPLTLSTNNDFSMEQSTTDSTVSTIERDSEVSCDRKSGAGIGEKQSECNENDQMNSIETYVEREYCCAPTYPSIEEPVVHASAMEAPAQNSMMIAEQIIKTSTFEAAATMDDVSDAELESYLQELEDLENSANSAQENAPSANTVDKSEIKNGSGAVISSEPVSDVPNIVGERDDRNADNFSQASTVEFADIHTNSELRMPMYGSNGDRGHEAEADALTVESDSLDQLNVDLFSESASNSMGESTAEAASAAVIRRPDTLPIASKIANANPIQAGSTPGAVERESSTDTHASDEAITSCSSSDESNIILTNRSNQFEDAAVSQCESDAEVSTGGAEQTPPSDQQNAPSNQMGIEELGKRQPYWIPDNMTMHCMQCNQKFSFLKRRHHCRACGQVLCALCASMKAKLEYLDYAEARICIQCDIWLNQRSNSEVNGCDPAYGSVSTATDTGSTIDEFAIAAGTGTTPTRSPNPNNPMEYCSMIPPYQQVSASTSSAPISVMVPVGVLKREGSASKSSRKEKNVMFSDGIRPGCDLTELDESWNVRSNNDSNGNLRKSSSNRRVQTPPGEALPDSKMSKKIKNNILNLPPVDPKTSSYIPTQGKGKDISTTDNLLPPICISSRTEFKYTEVANNDQLIERLKKDELKFIVHRNFYISVKIIKLTCCINKTVINFTTNGMHTVGQDEIVILLEMDSANCLPKDIFLHLNDIYRDADKGVTVSELGFSMANHLPFLGSKEHGGFLFIRPTFQCLQNVIVPENPYLIGILIHRWEVPWAKILPLRLMLRLGALHRYYPSPHVSVRGRNSVYAEIAQTIINFLADFRTYSFTIATIRGMYIHMEDRRTSVLIPKNRYDQIMKALNNSSDHILALAGNFSKVADGHLVCVQNTESGCAETHAYSTQAINIQGKPRKVTGATFFILNGALKTTSGLSGKCSIVEDGLMVQILPKKMVAIQQALKNMRDIDIVCGPVDADESQTEVVSIHWVENDVEFNVGVVSPIDKTPMDGVPSIRVHRGLDYPNSNHIIRWTEVFLIKSDDESAHGKDPVDMSKISEQIARSASIALVSFLDLLAANGLYKLAIRATIDNDQVCYEAGSNHNKLAPLYMNALDNELIPTLHRQATNLQLDQPITIELIFHILDV